MHHKARCWQVLSVLEAANTSAAKEAALDVADTQPVLCPNDATANLQRKPPAEEPCFELCGVSYHSPAGQVLGRHLELQLAPSTRGVLVTGPSGCGKTSLLRVVCGLWRPSQGKVVLRPSHVGRGGVFFVPQRPYITSGSLREQVLYPQEQLSDGGNVGHLQHIMELVGLGYLVEQHGWEACGVEWENILSGGEQQRLGLARVLYHRPAWAVMDESTSALDLELEVQCMGACAKAGIRFVSVGHRGSLRQFHDVELRLLGDGAGGFDVRAIAMTSHSEDEPEWSARSRNSRCPHDSTAGGKASEVLCAGMLAGDCVGDAIGVGAVQHHHVGQVCMVMAGGFSRASGMVHMHVHQRFRGTDGG